MARKDIVVYPDPVLRLQAKRIPKIDDATKKLIDDMFATLKAVNALGLAANQVGALHKVFVYDDGTGPSVLVNPEIISSEGEQIGIEACLSLPGLQGEVKRANEIVIRGKNLKGKTVKLKGEGLTARIFQHELDHLNGRLFIDRAEPGSVHTCADEEDEK